MTDIENLEALEKGAVEYCTKDLGFSEHYTNNSDLGSVIKWAFIAGANWQTQQSNPETKSISNTSQAES